MPCFELSQWCFLVPFCSLTVWDHVVFFAAVKGMPWKEAKVEAKE